MTTDEMLAQMKVWDHALELDRPDLDSLIWILAMDAGLRRALMEKVQRIARELEAEQRLNYGA